MTPKISPRPSAENAGSSVRTRDPPVSTRAKPRIMIPVASVVMIALTRPTVLIAPLISPRTPPTRTPSRIAIGIPTTSTIMAANTPEIAKIAPTERSRPPAMSTKVPPTATMPTIEDWSRTLSRFRGVRNDGLAKDR